MVIILSENVNMKLIEKIKSSEIDDQIKDFLVEILHLEYRHINDAKWRYSNEYERLIKRYAANLEEL